MQGYARCCDLQDGKGFAARYAKGATLEGKGFKCDSPETQEAIPTGLQIFVKTYHTLLNMIFDVERDSARGVIYSMANHLTPLSDRKYNDLVKSITCHDQYLRTGDNWRFKHRQVHMEFTENRTVENLDTMPEL